MTRLHATLAATFGVIISILVIGIVCWVSFGAGSDANVDQTRTLSVPSQIGERIQGAEIDIGSIAVPSSGLARIDLRFRVVGPVDVGSVRMYLEPTANRVTKLAALRTVDIPLAGVVSDQPSSFVIAPPVKRSESRSVVVRIELVGAHPDTSIQLWQVYCDCTPSIIGVKGFEPEVALWSATYSRRDRAELVLHRISMLRPLGFGATTFLASAVLASLFAATLLWILCYHWFRSTDFDNTSPERDDGVVEAGSKG